jgi:hypothetical protein
MMRLKMCCALMPALVVAFILYYGTSNAQLPSFQPATCLYAAKAAALGINDGCAQAPYGRPQNPTVLQRYGPNRPPWNVAGIDYHVGNPEDGLPLTDWRMLQSNPNWLYTTTAQGAGLLRCNAYPGEYDPVFDHYDFTTGTVGWSFYIPSCTSLTITNSKFGCMSGAAGLGAPAFYGFNIQAANFKMVFKNNTVDFTNCSGGGSMSSVIGNLGCTTCSLDFEYNYIKDSYSDIWYVSGNTRFVTYKNNYIENPAVCDPVNCPPKCKPTCTVHMNALSWGVSAATSAPGQPNIIVSFNTIFASFVHGGGGEFIQMYYNGGGYMDSPIVSNNTFPFSACRCVNNLVHGSTGYSGPATKEEASHKIILMVALMHFTMDHFRPTIGPPFLATSI